MKNQLLSDDLQIVRTANGIKLVKPVQANSQMELFTIGDLKELPVSFYFLNLDGSTCFINHEGAKVCGFTNDQVSDGQSLLAVSKPESAKRLIDNCSIVIQSDSIQIFEEERYADKVIEKFYAPFGTWKGLFFWLDVTKHWYEKKFPF